MGNTKVFDNFNFHLSLEQSGSLLQSEGQKSNSDEGWQCGPELSAWLRNLTPVDVDLQQSTKELSITTV